MADRLSKILDIDMIIAGVALVTLVILTFLGSIMRYFFNNPIIWQEEVQLGLIIWVVFLGGSAVFRRANHIAIDMIVEKFSEKARKNIEIAIYILGILILFFFMKSSYSLTLQFVERNRVTDILKIPSQYIYGAIPVGCLWMMVSYTLSTYEKYFKNNKLEKEV